MKLLLTALLLLGIVSTAHAKPIILEQKKTEALEKEGHPYMLRQINKVFVLVMPDGTEIQNPETLELKKDDVVIISNDEESYIHNIYDDFDKSWVIRKQIPGEIHGVQFQEKKEHSLRCAIHPKMKIKIVVE